MYDERTRLFLEVKIQEDISYLASINIELYVREKELGVLYSFEKNRECFNEIKRLATLLNNCPIKSFTDRCLDALEKSYITLLLVLREIKEFDPKNDAKDRNELLDRLDESFTNFLVHIRPIISFYSNSDKADDSSRILEEAKSILEYMKSSSVEMTKEKSSAIENAKKMLNELKDISAESGITKYSSVFADEARENKSIATKWLIGASILGVISIVVAYFVLQLRPTDSIPTTFEIVQYTLTKVIIFTILSYLLVLFVKNYNANRHNYIVNKHRQNALLTFSTFVNSAKDVDTKNAVLLQATQSIFTNQVSGYLKNECDSENPNKFIEIIKNVSSTKS